MKEELKTIINGLKGTVLVSGITNYDIFKYLDKNRNIEVYNLERKFRITKGDRLNGITDIKLNKIKKKHQIDYMICDVNGSSSYLRTIVKETYKSFNKQIIYYGIMDEYDVDRLIYKYKRLTNKITKKIYDNSFILIIEVNNIKTSDKKIKLYNFIDEFRDFFDAIGTILMK